MNEIQIIITGPAGSGKSTIAELIRKTLFNSNIKATLIDDNGIGIVDEPLDRFFDELKLIKCVESTSERSEVTIRTSQARRYSVPKMEYTDY